jgi:GH35 family endo-1,4-beta-xylanase
MKRTVSAWIPVAIAVALTTGWLLGQAGVLAAEQPTDDELLAGADARIEQHRKADAVILVVDAAGKPIPSAKVALEQTRHAFLFGANIFTWGRQTSNESEAAYRRQFAELLNYATLPFYWWTYEGQRGQPEHARTEEIARWCKSQEILTKGHPLAWNYAEPGWLSDNPQETRRLQMARIEDCVTRFRGLIDRWDVVNEVTHYDREECQKRAPRLTAALRQAGPMEFTRECFAHARQAGPQATLLINDYRTDPAYQRVIERLVASEGKRMYDVIGIQSHMHGGAWTNRMVWDVCERFARFGVPLHFTETTILSGQRTWDKPRGVSWPSTPEGEAYQAREAVRFYTMLFSHPAVEAITWWDFSDFHAWKGAPAGLVRSDMSPKPAYEELQKLVKGKWWTRATATTAPDGTAACRGFLGDYRVTVTLDGGKTIERRFKLAKRAENRWTVKVD